MATYKLDKPPQKKPNQIVHEQKKTAEKAYSDWCTDRKRELNRLSDDYFRILREYSARYRRGSLIMAVMAVVFLISRIWEFDAWYLSHWEKMLRPASLVIVVLVLGLACLDLWPYLYKSKMNNARVYAVICRILYWFGAFAVVLSYVKGTAAQVMYAGFMVALCALLYWVNFGGRQYRSSKGVDGLLSFLRWVILGGQCLVVLFPANLAGWVLMLLKIFAK